MDSERINLVLETPNLEIVGFISATCQYRHDGGTSNCFIYENVVRHEIQKSNFRFPGAIKSHLWSGLPFFPNKFFTDRFLPSYGTTILDFIERLSLSKAYFYIQERIWTSQSPRSCENYCCYGLSKTLETSLEHFIKEKYGEDSVVLSASLIKGCTFN